MNISESQFRLIYRDYLKPFGNCNYCGATHQQQPFVNPTDKGIHLMCLNCYRKLEKKYGANLPF